MEFWVEYKKVINIAQTHTAFITTSAAVLL